MKPSRSKTRIPLAWLKDCKTADAKKEREQLLGSSNRILELLSKLLQEDIRSIETISSSIKEFEEPNWPYKQAYRSGQKDSLRKVLELIGNKNDNTF